MKLNYSLLLLVLLVLSSFMTTPGSSVWENVQLIGANSKSVFSLNVLRYNSGSYYRSVDSLFVVEKNLMTGSLIERRPLKTVEFYQDPDSTSYVLTETYSKPFDLIAYQKDNDIEFLFKDGISDLLKFTNEGLYIVDGTIKELVMDKQTVLKFMNIENKAFNGQEKFHISLAYSHPQYLILIVDYGTCSSDEDFLQAIVSIPDDQYHNALSSYWDQINKLRKNEF